MPEIEERAESTGSTGVEPGPISLQSASDEELVAVCRRDASAFRLLYDRWSHSVLSWFQRRTGDAQVSLDLTAETFATVLERADSYRPSKGTVPAWIFGIARKKLQRWFRSRRVSLRAFLHLGAAMPRWDYSDLQRVEELADSEALRRIVSEVMDSCSRSDREILECRIIQRLPYSEIAARLGCSVGAARVRCHRALDRLSKELVARGVGSLEYPDGRLKTNPKGDVQP